MANGLERMPMSSGNVWACLLAVIGLGLTGCEPANTCEPCEEGCCSFVGSYEITLQYGTQGDSCQPVLVLPEDEDILTVTDQTGPELEFTLRDADGQRLATLTGTICDTIDPDPPQSYPFTVRSEVEEVDVSEELQNREPIQAHFEISGEFIDWGSTEGTLSMYGVLFLIQLDSETPENNCTLIRSFEAL
jgi:hypothetical protein